MLSPSNNMLAGKLLEITIGEPWDFESTAGQNKLLAKIINTAHPSEKHQWILLEVSPFKSTTNTLITKLVGIARYGTNLTEDPKQLDGCTCNFAYYPDGSTLQPKELENTPKKLHFLVGTIHLQRACGLSH